LSAQNQTIGPEWFETSKSENKILFCQTFVLQICNRFVSATSNAQAGGFSETQITIRKFRKRYFAGSVNLIYGIDYYP
jgi:hypothetical protein